MGVNYYTLIDGKCPTCQGDKERLNIGKSSWGWKFLFHQYKERGLTSAAAWREFLKFKTIRNEYDDIVDYDSFWASINERQEHGHTMASYAASRPKTEMQSFSSIDECEIIDDEGYRICQFGDFS